MSELPVLFFDRPLPAEFTDLVEGRATVVGPDPADLAGADGVIAGMHRWDAAAMAGGPRLRVISRTGVGYDTVDVDACTKVVTGNAARRSFRSNSAAEDRTSGNGSRMPA